jgi:hypothetical protein
MDVEEVVNNDEIQDGGSSSPIGVIGSRRPRNATVVTFDDMDDDEKESFRGAWKGANNEYEDENGDLEFIPDVPDF